MKLKRIIKNIIGKIIEIVEALEYRHLDLDENDPYKKILNTVKISDTCVKSDTGYVPVSEIHKTQPYTVYEVKTKSGKVIECADIHIVYRQTEKNGTLINDAVWIKDLNVGDFILTKSGAEKVVSIYKSPYKLSMYDVTVDTDEHRYYSNGILSHNTTTVSSFLSWMLIFHPDRNILVVANKEATAMEIVDKITNIFKGLPYFMKPGCINFGKTGFRLENGSRILSSATTNTASIGFTIHCILLDEFAHIPDNIVTNFWRSVYPTLSSSKISQCIITSTPNGTTNKFYEIWSNAIEKKNSFVPIRTDYWEVPSHDDAWAAKMKADFGEEEFAQEFELQFNINSKMLLKAEDMLYLSYFRTEFVHKKINSDNEFLNDQYLWWHPNFDPNDISPFDKFVFIVDTAEGTGDPSQKFKGGKDRTPDSNTISIFKVVLNSPCNMKKWAARSCNIRDAFRYIQVGKFECNSEDEEYAGKVCAALAYDLMDDDILENVKVMLEMNFNGKSFIQAMQKNPRYSESTIVRTYHTKPIPGEKQRRRLGFKTTRDKEYYCLKGAKMINMRRIIVCDAETFNQMQSFGYVKGKLKGIACHDDLSMPVFNHIPRMLNEETYVEWLEDILMNHKDERKKYLVNNIIEQWDMENPETSDSEFNALYGIPESGRGFESISNFTPPPQQVSPYTSVGNNMASPYTSTGPGGNVTYSSLVK